MQPVDRDDLVASMSGLWQKLNDVSMTLELRLKSSGKNTELVLSRAWKTLDELKKTGLAQIENDGPVVLCRLTPVGLLRKKEVSNAQAVGA